MDWMNNFKIKMKGIKTRLKKANIPKSPPMLTIIEKTFFDLIKPIKFAVSLLIMLIQPLILILSPLMIGFGSITTINVDFDSISVEHAASIITIVLAYPLFSWTFGIVFTSILGIFGAPLVAEEVDSGTILILVSKPINRYKIFLAKYIALFLYGILLSFSIIFLVGWIAVIRYSGNVSHFIGILPFLYSLFLYAILLTLIFTSITLAFSSIFKKSRNAALAVILIVVLSFLGFPYIKALLQVNYERFQIYHFDIGYHLGNVFVLFIEIFDAIPPTAAWQIYFAQNFGVFKYVAYVDPDQNINLGGLEKTNYYLPVISLLIWIIIALLLLFYGFISIKKREIYG